MSRAPRARAAEPPPEDPERLVRGNPELLGHEAAAAALEQAARSGRLPHAWLVTGAPGIGKATLCYRFARWLLAGAADRPVRDGAAPLWLAPEEPAFARVAAGAHADLRTVRPVPGESGTRLAIRIEDVRNAIRFLTLTPAEGGWRVVVLEDAEATRAEQANALLKTLEEPPPRAVLLLTTAAPGRLLPTIRSRCRRLALNPLPPPEMERWLAGRLPELGAEGRARLAALAEGSPGRALALAEADALAIQAMVEEVLGAAAKPDRRRWHALADGIAAKRDGSAFVTLMALLRRAINEGVREAARGGAVPGWLGPRSLAEWSTLWDRLGALAAETEALSLDRKQAVLTALGWIAAKEPP
jgi:DNA polymerase-3 subunit delta'